MSAGANNIFASVRARLRGVKGPDSRGWYQALCPFHSEKHPSFGFTEKGFKCQRCEREGGLAELARHLGVETGRQSATGGGIAAAYDYPDEQGQLLFQTVRKRPKGFFQRRPDGAGGWINNLQGVRLVLYRLPDLLSAAHDQALFVVEGEKDANRLWAEGIPATTNPMGAGKWRDEYAEFLRDRSVVIVSDNDDPGRAHAEQVARSLHGVAADIRVLELTDLPEKGDVSDWLDGGGTVEELLLLAEDAPAFVAPDNQGDDHSADAGGSETIFVSDRYLHEISEDGWRALQRANSPPTLFAHGLDIAQVVRDAAGRCSIGHLAIAGLRGRLDRCARWQKDTRIGPVPARPPKDVVEDMLALEKPLPPLKGIVGTPMFASDGSLDCTPGYQPGTHLYYEPAGEAIPPVPGTPDETDVKRAKAYLHQEWLADFPFLDQASLAHAIAIPLTVIAREMITGPTPLNGVDAPAPGSGKGLLCSSVGIIVSGREAAVMTETKGEEERKRITALIRAGHALLLLDNVKRKLESGTFAAMLTAPFWSDRILGATQDVELPVRGVWMATGNNLQFDSDISRRVVWIRIDARVDRPWERANFRKDNLLEWVRRHRHELVWACLILIQHWIAEGRPLWNGRPLGSFESWCSVIGGILQSAGIAGFLENRDELYSRADAETEEWRTFMRQWYAAYGEAPIKVGDILDIAKELLPSVFERAKDNATERALSSRLGKALAQRIDRSFDGMFIRRAGKDTHDGGALWRVDCGTSNGSHASTSAHVPHENGGFSDSTAEHAERAEHDPGSDSHFDDRGAGQHDRDSTADHVPHVPHVPQPDSNPGRFDAEHVRNVKPTGADVPQCRNCDEPVDLPSSNLCGACRKEALSRVIEGQQ